MTERNLYSRNSIPKIYFIFDIQEPRRNHEGLGDFCGGFVLSPGFWQSMNMPSDKYRKKL